MNIRSLEKKLERAKPVLLKKMRRPGADFSIVVLRNRDMEKVRNSLARRPDFKGAEAKKIRAEKMVNVLAFEDGGLFPHPETGKSYLGEVYLNLDWNPEVLRFGEPNRRSKASNRFEVLAPLLIHGFLHLLGYRHRSKRDTIKMEKIERLLWAHVSSSD